MELYFLFVYQSFGCSKDGLRRGRTTWYTPEGLITDHAISCTIMYAGILLPVPPLPQGTKVFPDLVSTKSCAKMQYGNFLRKGVSSIQWENKARDSRPLSTEMCNSLSGDCNMKGTFPHGVYKCTSSTPLISRLCSSNMFIASSWPIAGTCLRVRLVLSPKRFANKSTCRRSSIRMWACFVLRSLIFELNLFLSAISSKLEHQCVDSRVRTNSLGNVSHEHVLILDAYKHGVLGVLLLFSFSQHQYLPRHSTANLPRHVL